MKGKTIRFILLIIAFLLGAGLCFFSFFLPRFIETKILPSLGEQFFTASAGQVYSTGLYETSIGGLVIGEGPDPALQIASIRAHYSPVSVLERKVQKITIDGLAINLVIANGKLIIPGMDFERIAARARKNKDFQQAAAINLPIQFDIIQVNNGLISILYDNKHIFIPFDLQITGEEKKDTDILPVYRLTLQMFPQGEKINMEGSLEISNNRGIFNIAADSLDPGPFLSLGGLSEIAAAGRTSIHGRTEIRLNPFQVVAADINSELDSVVFHAFPVSFGQTDDAGQHLPLQLKISGNGQQWEIAVHALMSEPVPAALAFDGSLKHDNSMVKGSGEVSINLADREIDFSPKNPTLIFTTEPELQGRFFVELMEDHTWQAKFVSTAEKGPFGISYGHNNLTAINPSFTVQGRSNSETTRLEVSFDMEGINASIADSSEIKTPAARLHTALNLYGMAEQEKSLDGKFSIEIPGVNFRRDALSVKGDIALTGNVRPQAFHDVRSLMIDGELVIRDAEAREGKNSITVHSIQGSIPWQSVEGHRATGKLTTSGVTWNSNEIGKLEADISLEKSVYSINGRFINSLINGLVTHISVQADMSGPEYRSNMVLHSDMTPFHSLHLGQFSPTLFNSYLDGELGFDAEFSIIRNGIKGNMTLLLQNGDLSYPEKKSAVHDINFSLHLPALPDLRSAPAQELLFAKASIGDLSFEKGKILLQLESPDSFFIEEGVVRWAGGRVFTNAVRISPDKKEFIVPVFCDRLKLTELLHEFGISDAEGEGTVSGRIPMLIGKGTVSFEDGFLFSSPGQGGSVRVAAFDMLSTGIPKNTPQFAQVDFAAEALKNFRYNWVKLLFNSEGDDLFMQMQMDGKPVKSLPFSYDTKTGMLQRKQDGTQGIDQPIRLDVNFRLPLNRFLGYSGRIQDIIDKMK